MDFFFCCCLNTLSLKASQGGGFIGNDSSLGARSMFSVSKPEKWCPSGQLLHTAPGTEDPGCALSESLIARSWDPVGDPRWQHSR